MYKKIVFALLLSCCAMSCLSLKQIKSKKETAESAFSDSKQKNFYYYYYQALDLQEKKEYDKAFELLLQCYKIDSLHAGLNATLAWQHKNIGQIEIANRLFEKSMQLSPENKWTSMQFIQFLSEQKKWKQAIEVANELQKHYPEKPEVYSVLASLYTRTNNASKAIEAYDKMEEIIGVDEQLSLLKYQLYIELGNTEKAVEQFENLVKKFPTESRFQLMLGDVYLQQEMNDKAQKIYQEVLVKEPQNPIPYISLLRYYDTTGEEEKQKELVETAISEVNLAIVSKIDILSQHIENKVLKEENFAEIEALINLLVNQYPKEESTHTYYALFLKHQQKEDLFLRELKTILSINPKNEFALSELIQFKFNKKRYKEVVKTASEAIEKNQETPIFYFYKALAQLQLKEYKETTETSLQLLGLIENSGNKELESNVYSLLGDAYYKLTEKEKAFSAYEKALQLTPNNIYVMNNYAYYLSLEKENLHRAEALSAKTIEIEPNNSTFLDTYAWILYQQKNYLLAKFYLERAIENLKKEEKDESGTILDHYGDVLWMNGEKEKAVEQWEKASSAGLDSVELKEKIKKKNINAEKNE